MKTARIISTICLVLVAAITMSACELSFARPTATPLPTATNTATVTVKPTNTVKPTATITLTPTMWHLPTNTIDATATAQSSDMLDYVTSLREDGYIRSTDGLYNRLEDYSNQWAQLNWYQWSYTGAQVSDFIFRGHMAWSSDHETPNPSGCGVVFRVQNTNEHYVIFLLSLGYLEFGITTDEFDSQPWVRWGKSQNEGEADFALIAVGPKFDVFVNGDYIQTFYGYQGKWERGALAYTTLSGTNAGYGTQCDITNADLWMLKK